MAGSVNKAIIVGNLGKDPDIRRTQDGKTIASFSVATSETWKDRNSSERKERTHWHNVVVFNENLAKIVDQQLKKGSKVYVEGSMQTRKWTDNKGVDRYITEVILNGFGSTLVLLDKREGASAPPASGPDDYGRPPAHEYREPAGNYGDEIPF